MVRLVFLSAFVVAVASGAIGSPPVNLASPDKSQVLQQLARRGDLHAKESITGDRSLDRLSNVFRSNSILKNVLKDRSATRAKHTGLVKAVTRESDECEAVLDNACLKLITDMFGTPCGRDGPPSISAPCCPAWVEIAECHIGTAANSDRCNDADREEITDENMQILEACQGGGAQGQDLTCTDIVDFGCLQFILDLSTISCQFESPPSISPRCCPAWNKVAQCIADNVSDEDACSADEKDQQMTVVREVKGACSELDAPKPIASPAMDLFEIIYPPCQKDVMDSCGQFFNTVSQKGCPFVRSMPADCCEPQQNLVNCALKVMDTSGKCGLKATTIYSEIALDVDIACSASATGLDEVSSDCGAEAESSCSELLNGVDRKGCHYGPNVTIDSSCCEAVQIASACVLDVADQGTSCNDRDYTWIVEAEDTGFRECGVGAACKKAIADACEEGPSSCAYKAGITPEGKCCDSLTAFASCAVSTGEISDGCSWMEYFVLQDMKADVDLSCDEPPSPCQKGVDDTCRQYHEKLESSACDEEDPSNISGPCCPLWFDMATCRRDALSTSNSCEESDRQRILSQANGIFGVCPVPSAGMDLFESIYPPCQRDVMDSCGQDFNRVSERRCPFGRSIPVDCCEPQKKFATCALKVMDSSGQCGVKATTFYSEIASDIDMACPTTISRLAGVSSDCAAEAESSCSELLNGVDRKECHYGPDVTIDSSCCEAVQSASACVLDVADQGTSCNDRDYTWIVEAEGTGFRECGVGAACKKVIADACEEGPSSCAYKAGVTPEGKCCDSLTAFASCAVSTGEIFDGCSWMEYFVLQDMKADVDLSCDDPPSPCQKEVDETCRQYREKLESSACDEDDPSSVSALCCPLWFDMATCMRDALSSSNSCEESDRRRILSQTDGVSAACPLSSPGIITSAPTQALLSTSPLPVSAPGVPMTTTPWPLPVSPSPGLPPADNGVPEFPKVTPAASSSPANPPSPEQSAVPSLSEVVADKEVCFPGQATVTLKSGLRKRMDALEIGDVVLSSGGEYSTVFFFSHRLPVGIFNFIRISTERESLTVSASHYILSEDGLVAARDIGVGSTVMLGRGGAATVESVEHVLNEGLYNPHTLSGEIVVDGVRASCYTTAVYAPLAELLLSPFRAVYQAGFVIPAFLDVRGPAHLLPGGPSSI